MTKCTKCKRELYGNTKCSACETTPPEIDNGFALGLATGIPISAMGIIGASMHNSIVSDHNSPSSHSSPCTDSYSSDCSSSSSSDF